MKKHQATNLSLSLSLLIVVVVLSLCMACEDDDARPQEEPMQDPPLLEETEGTLAFTIQKSLFYYAQAI